MDVIRLFERAQRRKGLRHRTILERTRTLLRLERDVGPLLSLSCEQIEDWLDARGVSDRSRGAYLSRIVALYQWAAIAGLRVDDPTLPIVAPRVQKGLPRPIDDDDLDMALRMADPRMRCWLTLACYEGFRCFEIAPLRREDILDRRDPAMLVIPDGKGGKEGIVPLHPDVLAALHAFGLPQSGYVFTSQRGQPFSPATISGYGADYLHGLGIPATMHQLRHWFGTAVYAATHDLRVTQEVMRHSDPASTAGYVAFDNAAAAAAVTALAPRLHHERVS